MPPKFIKMGIMWRPCLCIEDLIKQVRPAAGTAGGQDGEGMGPCECVGFALKQRGSYVKIRKITVRARLKIHSRNLHASLRDIFVPNSVAVAHYAAFIWAKSPTKCDAQLLKAIFKYAPGKK